MKVLVTGCAGQLGYDVTIFESLHKPGGVLAYGIPAVLSCYFDLFSGFVQAYVFTLLTMVYISGSLPEPKAAETNEGNS